MAAPRLLDQRERLERVDVAGKDRERGAVMRVRLSDPAVRPGELAELRLAPRRSAPAGRRPRRARASSPASPHPVGRAAHARTRSASTTRGRAAASSCGRTSGTPRRSGRARSARRRRRRSCGPCTERAAPTRVRRPARRGTGAAPGRAIQGRSPSPNPVGRACARGRAPARTSCSTRGSPSRGRAAGRRARAACSPSPRRGESATRRRAA